MTDDIKNQAQISMAEILEKAPNQLGLKVIAGEDNLENNYIDSALIQKLGLAFAGYIKYIHQGRVQMIGQSEVSYLSQLDEQAKSRAIKNLDLDKITCILVTKNLELPAELKELLKFSQIPVLKTPLVSSEAISRLSKFLRNVLAPTRVIHGVMLGMYGLGILILGKSGIGKSECALDLIRFGHRLVSDDSVIIKKIGDTLEASSPELTFQHLEIRGLGILNIKDLYGVSAIGQSAKINLCIELKKWDKVVNQDRLGLTMQEESIFEKKVPKFILPVSSGRNITTLVETAVRVHLLKLAGHDAAQKLIDKHDLAVSHR